LRQALYGLAVSLAAAGGLVLEIVAGRLLAPYVGMSLYTWTAIIAVVLAGFSIGHWIGGRLAGADCIPQAGARRVALAFALASAAALAALILLRLVARPLLAVGLSPILAIVLLASVLFLLPSLFIGIVSPILTKLAVDDAPEPGRAIGRMYALGALGSIAGTLAAGYLFIAWIGSTGTVLAVAAVYALIALVFARVGRSLANTAALLAILASGFGFAGARLDAFAAPCTVESDYYCIRIADFSRQSGRPSAVMVLDHLGHGINDRDDPTLLYSAYLQLTEELARQRFGPDRLDALLVGGGALTLPRAWLAGRQQARIMVAEIDPTVTRTAIERMWIRPDARLDIRHGDARVVVQSLSRAPLFDVVLGDVFHDISMPAHLVTREFHDEIKARLKSNGFYAVNVIESARAPRFLLAFMHTLSQSFGHVQAWVEDGDIEAAGRITYLVTASDAAFPEDHLSAERPIARRWTALPMQDRKFTPLVLIDDHAPVDRLMSHILLDPDLAER
jgi:spermidine synthase